MFERFSDRARRSIVVAMEFARTLGHGSIGTHHMLYGILVCKNPVASKLLTDKGLTSDAVKIAVDPLYEHFEDSWTRTIPFTPGAKKHLELSLI